MIGLNADWQTLARAQLEFWPFSLDRGGSDGELLDAHRRPAGACELSAVGSEDHRKCAGPERPGVRTSPLSSDAGRDITTPRHAEFLPPCLARDRAVSSVHGAEPGQARV